MKRLATFSPAERRRRRRAAEELMEEFDAQALVVYGDRGDHADLLWLTGFAPHRDAALLLPRRGEPVLYVNYYNHLLTAREASWIERVEWGRDAALATAAAAVARLGHARVLTSGSLGREATALGEVTATVDVSRRLYERRIVRSAEEIAVIRHAAALSDAAVEALRERARPGMTEHELLALVEAEWTPRGARTGIAYIGVNRVVPAQQPTARTVRAGEVITVELSASVDGYWGQVLRTFTVGGGALSAPHAELHALALRTFDEVRAALRAGARTADLAAAGTLVDRSGRTIVDDLAHLGGSVGTYRPSVRTPASALGPTPDFEYRAGMCVVVQPNVVDVGITTGVQYGELLLVTESGTERLHRIA